MCCFVLVAIVGDVSRMTLTYEDAISERGFGVWTAES
jgi:hypothetical protein